MKSMFDSASDKPGPVENGKLSGALNRTERNTFCLPAAAWEHRQSGLESEQHRVSRGFQQEGVAGAVAGAHQQERGERTTQ